MTTTELSLRDYQTAEIEAVRDSIRHGHKRIIAVLPCGAGKTVIFAYMSKRHIEMSPNNRVLFLVHRRELIDQTVETFRRFGLESDRVEIAMAQTVTRHLDEIKKPTMIVLDEVHHATSKTWTRILEKFPNVTTIGLTATPTRLDGRNLGDLFSDMKIGVSSKWLIEHKYLSEYDYFAPRISTVGMEWELKGSDYDMQKASEVLRRAKIFGDVMKYLDLSRKTIIYCPTVEMSKQIAEKIGDGAVHFDGETPKAERARIVKEFREGKIRVLCNCELIGEGFDVPDCDCVFMLRPTQSTALYIQQSMRCLRPKEGKRATIYDFVGNCYRHGLPTDDREWSLVGKTKCRNPSGEKEITCRTCSKCFRIYEGTGRICPFCGNDNGKTRKEIEREEKAELERITELKKKEARKEIGRARTLDDLIIIGKKRGYANPYAWAYMVMKGRNR